ncbi:abortive infection family protein [bacterium]|nr:abortive infection family protein [bacterium]
MGSYSLPTINALALAITGGSGAATSRSTPGIYRTAWNLEQFFGGIRVDFSVSGRSRVPAVLDCLKELNENNPLKIEEAILAAVDPREYIDMPGELEAVVEYLNERLAFDDMELRLQGKLYRLVSTTTANLSVAGLKAAIDLTDYDSVRSDFERSLGAADRDPEDAITAACSTVESVCKCILDEMNQPYPKREDIKALVSEVGKHLNLSPSRTDLPENIAADIKQVLSGLVSVTSGIGALRTHAGDAHGRGRMKAPVDARIARLAIHSASTVSLFYIETWNRMKQSD